MVRTFRPYEKVGSYGSPFLLTVLRNSIKYSWCGCLLLGIVPHAAASPNLQGQSGYINMPSASLGADGLFNMGYSYDSPYGNLWVSTNVLPFLQLTGRYVSITGIPAFGDSASTNPNYGRYKDKVADAKVRLWSEGDALPGVAVGANDLLGTGLFKGQYVVATKTFGQYKNIEASVGYGFKRPEGVFGGIRWRLAARPNWSLVAEYDGNDYTKDRRALETGAAERGKGPSVAVEYRWGWIGAQVARHREHFSANAYLSIPFAAGQFIPKILEPAPFNPSQAPTRVTEGKWRSDSRHAAALVQALSRQNFKNVRVRLEGQSLNLSLTNTRISNMGRAVGRAARTALAFAPEGLRTLRITYTKLDQPLVIYEFLHLATLSDYLSGLASREQFLKTVLIRYAQPNDALPDNPEDMLAGLPDDLGVALHTGRDGHVFQVTSEDRESNGFSVVPKLSFFFNDPSGALRYEVAAAANYTRRLAPGLFVDGAARLSIIENITGVTQESNSLLPHVRTDVANYKRGNRLKLNRLLVNKYYQPWERWYTRASGGFYEEMYRGVGGQVLYLPEASRWAADLSIDALQQRGYEGWFAKRDYQTVTALGALHYRLPYDITLTARGGRFLAKDKGVRLEFKRRFSSGIEIGAWYTKTNGNDITNPGTLANPYNDKGIFLSIPLNSMLPTDTQASSGFALSPWTRDVGQTVASPGDLYDILESPHRDMYYDDALGNFAERPDWQEQAALNAARGARSPWPAFQMRLEQSRSAAPSLPDWAPAAGLAAGTVLGSALLDKPVDSFVAKHEGARSLRSWDKFGKALPIGLVGAAGAAVVLGEGRLRNTGLISLQSVGVALGVKTAAKYAVGRARPDEERGPWAQVGNGRSRSDASFPSGHSAAAFAAVTPFAKEYDAPWLYGLAALGSAGRVAGRSHWVSDTVAGGFIGYAVGSWLWHAQRDNTSSGLSINPGPREISVAWRQSY